MLIEEGGNKILGWRESNYGLKNEI
jgi:hypothetical protein